MMWFSKKKQEKEIVVHLPPQSRVEIELSKSANKEASEKAKAVNAQATQLLKNNGFTVRMYVATGGSHPKEKN